MPCLGGNDPLLAKEINNMYMEKLINKKGRAVAQACSRWLPTDAVSSPGFVKWDLWWKKWRWGWFSPSTLVSPA
jgi:hypothetical protein